MRRGVTLIELLVVISIIVLLAAITIPAVKPAVENRKTREAARMVETILNRARVEAVEHQRPVGVQLVRSARQSEACVTLALVQDAGLYTGETNSARVCVQAWGTGAPQEVRIILSYDAIKTDFLRDGDRFQFGSPAWGSAGPTYEVFRNTNPSSPPQILPDFPRNADGTIDLSTGVTTTAWGGLSWIKNRVLSARLIHVGVSCPYPQAGGAGNTFPPPAIDPHWSQPMQFVIWRKPDLVRGGSVVQLPSDVCIDLYESGTSVAQFIGTEPVTVLFGTNGAVKQILGTNAIVNNDLVALLVTTFDRLPAEAAPIGSNRGAPVDDSIQDPQPFIECDPSNPSKLLRGWRDPRSLWVGIRQSTGQTVTAEVATVDESQLPATVLPAGQFNYNSHDALGEHRHLLWGLRKSRALLAEPAKAL